MDVDNLKAYIITYALSSSFFKFNKINTNTNYRQSCQNAIERFIAQPKQELESKKLVILHKRLTKISESGQYEKYLESMIDKQKRTDTDDRFKRFYKELSPEKMNVDKRKDLKKILLKTYDKTLKKYYKRNKLPRRFPGFKKLGFDTTYLKNREKFVNNILDQLVKSE